MDAVTGESQYYEEVPNWVDALYVPELIMQQYDCYGTLVNGFLNSVLSQRDVTISTLPLQRAAALRSWMGMP